jgi:hypothetical protein
LITGITAMGYRDRLLSQLRRRQCWHTGIGQLTKIDNQVRIGQNVPNRTGHPLVVLAGLTNRLGGDCLVVVERPVGDRAIGPKIEERKRWRRRLR